MAIRIQLGEPHDGRRDPWIGRLAEIAAGRAPLAELVYLVRTNRRAIALREEILRECGAIFELPALTLPNWVLRLGESLPGGRPPADPLAEHWIAERVLARWAEEGEGRLAAAAKAGLSSLPRRLARLIGELKQQGIADPKTLEDRLAGAKLAEANARELVALFERFESERVRAGVATKDDKFFEVLAALGEGALDDALPRTLVLEGFYEANPVHLDLLAAIADRGTEVLVLLDGERAADGSDGRVHLRWWGALAQDLLEKLLERGAKLEESPPGADTAARRNLLAAVGGELGEEEGRAAAAALEGWIDVRPRENGPGDASTAREIERLADEVRALHRREPDLDLGRVGVVFADLGKVAPLVRETFARRGIPVDLSEDLPLAGSPVGAALGAALELVRCGLTRRTVRVAFSQGLLAFHPEAGEANVLTPRTAIRLDQLAREASMVDDDGDWAERLEKLAKRLDEELADLPRVWGDDHERLERERNRIGRRLGSIARWRATLEALEELRRSLFAERRTDGASFVRSVRRWLEALRLPRRIVRLESVDGGAAEEGELSSTERLLRRDIAAWGALEEGLQRFALSCAVGEARPRTPSKWASEIESAAADWTFQEEAPSRHRVRVLGRLELRQLAFDHLFVAGLSEGEFPTPRRPDPLLPEAVRAKLGFAGAERSARECDYLLALAFFSAGRHLGLSAPRGSGDEARPPAPVLVELDRLMPGTEAEAPGAPAVRLADLKAVQLRLGQLLNSADAEAGRWAPALLGELARRDGLLDPAQLAACVEAERRRAHPERLSVYDGILEGEAVPAALAERYGTRVFSAGQFEAYARCPMAYFFERVLGVEVPEEPEREFGSLQRGSLVHRILERFYNEEGREQLSALWNAEDESGEIRRKARASLARIAAEEREAAEIPLTDQRVYVEDVLLPEDRRGLLDAVLEIEVTRLGGAADFDGRFEPFAAEASFGPFPGESESALSEKPVVLGESGNRSTQLRGRVDRIDLVMESAGGRKGFRIFDYKTGKTAGSISKTHKGLLFQIPIYAVAVQELLRERLGEEVEFLGGGYYQIAEQGVDLSQVLVARSDCGVFGWEEEEAGRKRSLRLKTREELGAFVARVKERAESVHEHILKGKFHPTLHGEAEGGCAYCPYATACRVDHPRMSGIDPEANELLTSLDEKTGKAADEAKAKPARKKAAKKSPTVKKTTRKGRKKTGEGSER